MTDFTDENVHLPFDAARQFAILGHCIIGDKAFLLQCLDKIQPSWFVNPLAAKTFDALQTFHKERGRRPTIEELKTCSKIQLEEPQTRSALHGAIAEAKLNAERFGLDLLREDMTEWFHARLFFEGVVRSEKLFNNGKFKDAYEIITKNIDKIRTTTFEEDRQENFGSLEFLGVSQDSYEDGLTTGLDILDRALSFDQQPKPALYRGDTTVILAPSNVGKTSWMATVAIHNVLRKKHVLFLTHEGRPSDIKEKMLQSALKVTKGQLFSLYESVEGVKTLQRIAKLFDDYLCYVPYNKAGMTVEEVTNVIRRKQEEHIILHGVGFDMLVDDYPAKLTTERAKGGQLAKRNMDAIVYDYFVQLALEYNWHSLVAIQTNRQGSRDNKASERLLTMEDVAESWDVMTMATNVITLNRDIDLENKGRVINYVCKSRSTQTGIAVVANSNYAACVTHWTKLGGSWYKGDSRLSDQLDRLMELRLGQEITYQDMKNKALQENLDFHN